MLLEAWPVGWAWQLGLVERTSVMKKKVAFTDPREGVMRAILIFWIHPATFQRGLIGKTAPDAA